MAATVRSRPRRRLHPLPPQPVGFSRGAPSTRLDIAQEFETGCVGAPLVGARPDIVQKFETGRDKPVPYGPAPASIHEFKTGPRRGAPCGRPSRHRAEIRRGTGQARPLRSRRVPCMNSEDRVGAPLVGVRLDIVQESDTGRDKPVPYGRPRQGRA